MKSELRTLILLALTITIILNVIGIYNVNVMTVGFFILVAVYSLVAIKYTKLMEVLLFSIVIAVFSEITKLAINYFFNYSTIISEGDEIPLWVTLLSGFVTIVLSALVSLIFSGGKLLFGKK